MGRDQLCLAIQCPWFLHLSPELSQKLISNGSLQLLREARGLKGGGAWGKAGGFRERVQMKLGVEETLLNPHSDPSKLPPFQPKLGEGEGKKFPKNIETN